MKKHLKQRPVAQQGQTLASCNDNDDNQSLPKRPC